MKNLLVLLLLVTPLWLMAQDDDDSYIMYETVMLEPNTEKLSMLMDKMKEHNETFHSEGASQASIWRIVNGPNTGKLMWVMGPTTFTQIGEMDISEDHMDHWMNQVMPNISDMDQGEYWRLDEEMSNTDNSDAPSPMLYIRFLKIKKGEGHNWKHLMEVITSVRKEAFPDDEFGIYINEFIQGDIGRHITITTAMDGWSQLDEERNMAEAYEEKYGKGSWNTFMRNWQETFEDAYDEIWILMPEMMASGDN